MWHRKSWRFYFGIPPFGSYFHGFRLSPSKEEYLDMLQEYKKELENEVRDVEREIEEVTKST